MGMSVSSLLSGHSNQAGECSVQSGIAWALSSDECVSGSLNFWGDIVRRAAVSLLHWGLTCAAETNDAHDPDIALQVLAGKVLGTRLLLQLSMIVLRDSWCFF